MITVAIAEDHPVVRSGLISLIEKMGLFEVAIEATNGRELLESINQRSSLPDICIVDLQMPEMDGFETIANIKYKWPTMPVLVFTVFVDDFYIIKMIRARANGYLTKMASAVEIKEALLAVYKDGIYYASADMRSYCRAILRGEINLPDFTAKEVEIIRLCCTDLGYGDIAVMVNITKKSLEGQIEHIKRKCKVESRIGIALFAVRFGIVHLNVSQHGLSVFNTERD